MTKSLLQTWLGVALAISTGAAYAKDVEEITELPVEVANMYGRVFQHSIKVTIFRDDERPSSPFLVLNHGRAVYEADRAKLGRARFSDNAKYFVANGFAVFVPTRVGYGVTGGPDVEESGDCSQKNYRPGFEAAAQQTAKVIEHARALPYIDSNKGLVVGQSFGGATAIAVASKNPPGILAAINFAGGGGGNPQTRPERPCRDDLLAALFSAYGASSQVPTLWLYSENDKYFGREKPRNWFNGFVAKSGSGQFIQLPPFKDDGHSSFAGNPSAWRPMFEEFIRSIGLLTGKDHDLSR